MGKSMSKLAKRISSLYPDLKLNLRIAHIRKTPTEFIHSNIKFSIPFSLGLSVLFFFIADKAELPMIILPFFFIVAFVATFSFGLLKLKAAISKRQKEIDREVLFAGQYLLIKLYSGKPLLNALIDTQKSYGVASKYMGEIVNDIDTGSTIEEALENAMVYSPSQKFSKILFHINNALRLGIDVTGPLSAVLEEITNQQETEIKKYGKKLNSMVIFYMLAAIVIPSIGMALFIVLSSFINFSITTNHFLVVLFFLLVMEFLFIGIFRGIRPTVNL